MIDVFAELDKKFDIVKKTRTLCNYLTDEYVFFIYCKYSTYFKLLYKSFHKWELNRGYSDLNDFLVDAGVAIKLDLTNKDVDIRFSINNEDDCYVFLQIIKNSLEFMYTEYNELGCDSLFKAIEGKINYIIEKVNLTFIYDEQKKYYKLIENKPLVREIAQNTDIVCASLLYEYNAVGIKDDVDKKKEILVNLATYTESITKSYINTSGDVYELFNNLDFALNNFHIRHNNLDGKNKKDYLLTLNEKQRIELYDATYDLILAVLNQNQTRVPLEKIKRLRSNF